MPDEKLETIQTTLDLWNRGEWDAVFDYAAPEFEFDNSTVTGEWRGVHRGRDEVRRMWTRFTEPWSAIRIEIDEVLDRGPSECVVLLTKSSFDGRGGVR